MVPSHFLVAAFPITRCSYWSSCHPIMYCREPGNGWSCKVFFAKSYRICVPELKSDGWLCAILGQVVGITKIQDSCREPGKLQNVFIFRYIMRAI